MKRTIFVPMLAVALVTFACGSSTLSNTPDQSGVETIVAATMHALPSSVPVYQFENVSISIPNSLGAGITPARTDDVELPFINPSNGPMPQHIVLDINGYAIGRKARIVIFKASEYSTYTDITQQAVTTLQTQPYQAGQPIAEALTLGPLNPQAKSFSSQNGHGLRYITEILTGVAPVSNDQVFYYYQGLTNDSLYYISAAFPISAAFLVADGNPASALPVDGIAFPRDNAGAEEFNAYYAAISERLNTADAGVFQPSLGSLDSMIQSISIQ